MRRTAVIGWLLYAVLLAAFWIAVQRTVLPSVLRSTLPAVFVSFALILAPLLAFGLGGAEWLTEHLRSRAARILAPGLAVVPYLLSALPAGTFRWPMALTFACLPIALALLLEPKRGSAALSAVDVIAIAGLGLPVLLHWVRPAWPQPGLSGLPKLLLTDVALYLYLVVRQLPRAGYDLHLRRTDLPIGAREWLFFAPLAISIGLALEFLHVHAVVPPIEKAAGALVFTFLFIALPEEFFFRSVILNLLESRMRPVIALIVSAVLFGLAHFNKGATFNWRYVLLASLAGIFYGRAWRAHHRIFAAAIAHTLVDVTWSLWFH